jgi:hypothetical protein
LITSACIAAVTSTACICLQAAVLKVFALCVLLVLLLLLVVPSGQPEAVCA